MTSQHRALSPDRWAGFSLDQQILMIANEMNRAAGLVGPDDGPRLASAYARVLRLVDLTVEVQRRRSLRRELLRWRDLVARLYVTQGGDARRHAEAFRCLLRFTPTAARQLTFVAGGTTGDGSAPGASGEVVHDGGGGA